MLGLKLQTTAEHSNTSQPQSKTIHLSIYPTTPGRQAPSSLTEPQQLARRLHKPTHCLSVIRESPPAPFVLSLSHSTDDC